MARIRLHLGNLNIGELVALARQVRAAMRDNSNFSTLRSQVAFLADEVDELMTKSESYKSALQLVQQRLAEQQAQRIKLENLLTELATGIEDTFGENTDMLKSAGFDVSMSSAGSTSLRAPRKLPVGIEGAAALR